MRVLLILAVIGLASAVPLTGKDIFEAFTSSDATARNSVIEEAILRLAEDLRQLIYNGGGIFPVLDPYEREHAHIYGILVGLPGSHLTLNNIHATGLGTFQIDSLSVVMTSLLLQQYRAEFDITIPTIDASAENYDVLVTIFGTNVYGNGEASFKVNGARFIGWMDIGVTVNNGIFLNIRDCRLTFRLSEFVVTHLTGVFNDDASSQYYAEWLQEMVPYLLGVYQDDIADVLSFFLRELGNRYLESRDIGDLLSRSVVV